MRFRRSTFTRVAVTAAAAALVAGMAAATPAEAVTTLGGEAATTLAQRIDSPGAYVDRMGRTVVTVTTPEQARAVRDAGAYPRMVEHSLTQLQDAVGTLNSQARIPGTTWGIDPMTNRVEVSYDSTVSRAELARLTKVAGQFGSAVRITRDPGTLSTLISGGQAIYTGGSRCSLGFNVNRGGVNHFLTAGHCTNIGYSWYGPSSSTYLGYRVGSYFPGQDHGIVRYNSSSSRPGNVYLYNGSYRDITGAGNAYVGQYIYRSGSTTGLRGGYVQALNQTVNYSQGSVYGLIKTNACAEGGDSGGSMFAGNTALGMTSGGSGNCTYGGTTFFEPVTRALSYWGATIY